VYLSPFVATGVATVQLRLPRTLLSCRQLDIRGPALRADSMIDVHFQRVDNVARLRVLVPEHTQVAYTNRCHQGAYHLVELARG